MLQRKKEAKDMNEEDMSKLRLYCPFMSKAMDKVCKKSRIFRKRA